MQGLNTNDYRGSAFWQAIGQGEEEDEAFKLPLVLKARKRGTSVSSLSGSSTPGLLGSKTLSAGDLERADEALSNHQGVNGH